MPAVPSKAGSLLRLPVTTTVLVGLAVAGLLATIWVAASPRLVSAADLREFNPGSIITDQVFFDSGSMSAAGVQAFLADKGSACELGADKSECLHSYTMATTSRAATTLCPAGYQGAAQESAAMIIYKVAQACGINPQVLLVTLQKEMGFIRTTNPTAKMYERAMGYACPDNGTGQCDPAYAGLQNQLYRAAGQFQRYVQEPTRYAYRAGITNYILYHPYNDCGRQSVYIQNGATAALYNYTPYVPDAAALAAGYGNGGKCSSYGNRNFFSYFTDWFGSTQSTGSGAINLKYMAMGGSASYLGEPVAATSCGLAAGGCGRAYQNGSIYWSSSSGAAVVEGEVRAGWWATGGVSGTLGYPIADSGPITGGAAGAFQGGSVYWSPTTGAAAIGKELLGSWWSAGGASGRLGWPVASSGPVAGGGTGGAFQGGSIYWSPTSGAHWLADDIRGRWWALGGTTGTLGFPTSDLVAVPGGTGAAFQGGSIYSSPGTGAHAVQGGVRAGWWARGGTSGPLGFPTVDTADLTGTGGVKGQVGAFSGGTVYSSSATAPAVLSGNVLAAYLAAGGPADLGFPVADQAPVTGGEAAALQHASIYSSAGTGAHVVSGAVRSGWWARGGITGPLGYPTADTAAVTGAGGVEGQVGAFSGGTVYSSSATAPAVLSGNVLAAYLAAGGPADLGFPVADQAPLTGGEAAALQHASIYSSAGTGAHVVSGAVRSGWWARGGITGPLGYPTADTTAVTGAGGVKGQVGAFSGGRLYSSSATAPAVLSGNVLAAYLAAGGPAVLGFPVADQAPLTGGEAAALQHASIYSSAGTGAHVVSGAVRSGWWARGGITGPLGYPTADTAAVTGAGGVEGQVGAFSGGTVYSSSATAPAVLSGNVLAAYLAAGGPAVLGFPVADQAPVTGGEAAALQHASIYSSAGTGAHVVRSVALPAFWGAGGVTGPLGFPTVDTATAAGVGSTGTVTTFQGGSIYGSSSTGVRFVLTAVDTQYRAAGGPASSYGWPTSNTYAVTGGVRNDFQSGQITG
ncbi:hypothetical protein [Blastococcus sp. CT_GayMR19]|uniref:hypothetical protein n=1 Tax=Blastococcus sp. CT_GayMR19 TaxID=2559608 RepID=UPI0014319F93|nr:hypothetical protein [Blastococcus sp. CT_GayMR19]